MLNGRRYRKVIGTKKQAEKVQKKLEAEIAEGKWDVRGTEDIPFSQLVDEYLEFIKLNKAVSTSKIRKYRIEAHLQPYFKDVTLSQITPQMVDNYKALRLRVGASPNTVNRELANLSHMLKMAVRWRYVNVNAVSGVQKMRVPERNCRFLDQEEIRKLLQSAKESYAYPLVMTAVHTGIRKSEILNLKWSDIDFTQRTVTIQAKADWHTKNYRTRTVQLTPALYEALKEHERQCKELGIQNEYVFTYRGRRIKGGISTTLKAIVKGAGLDNVTLHTLRHTFASQLVMAGVSLRDVQELMGHRSFETTLQYAHLSEEHVKKQVLRLPFANG